MSKELGMDLQRPLHDILPKEWHEQIPVSDYVAFRNLQHFKHYVGTIKQRKDNKCGVSYREALNDLITERSQYSKQEYETIRNLVRQNLQKRGLITDEIYEKYKYNYEGQVVDISELVTGNPECVLTPAYNYKSHFYELYISISYPYHVSNEKVRENAIKLLSTIEELERQHIFIKVTLVFADRSPAPHRNLLMVLPLFSYKDFKSIETMSAVINERLLRKFAFAMLENIYGNELVPTYGNAVTLPKVINIGDTLNEIELFEKIKNHIEAGVR